jgi:putative copper resistance protein D
MTEVEAWLELASTWTLSVAFAVVCGSIVTVGMLRRPNSGWSRSRSRASAKVLRGALVATLVSFAFLLWAKAAAISEQPLIAAARSIGDVVAHTHVGHAWLVGAVSLLILALTPRAPGESPRGFAVFAASAGACAIVFAASRSAMSHAGASGEWMPWLIEGVHLIAVSVWSGSVFVAAFVVFRRPYPVDVVDRRARASYARLLSATATWALAGVLGTGALSAWRALGSTTNVAVLETRYGQVLVAKLVLVAIAIALGAYNRYRTLPSIVRDVEASGPDATAPAMAFRRVLLVESGVLLAILGVAGVLSTSAPPSSDPTLSFTPEVK